MHTLVTAGFGTVGIADWIRANLVTVLILIAGAAILWAARGGNVGKGITIIAGVFLGVAVLGLATGTTATDVGSFLVGLARA